MRTLTLFAFAFVAWLQVSASAVAHPHLWVGMRTGILFDDAGKVEALQVHWRFDELYSLLLLEELKGPDGEISDDRLQDLARQNIENLKEFSYFTFIEVAGQKVSFREITQYESKVEGNRVSLDFIIPLKESVDPLLQSFNYAIFDPTYFISFVHMEQSPVVLDGDARPECRYAIEEPDPNPEVVSFANSLDKTESGGDGLGIQFTERVALLCE